MDLSKKIKSIEQIQYPVACFGELKILVSQRDGVGNLDAYGTFGSRCINWTNIRVESEETSKELNLTEQESSCDSPTVKCMAKIGINCECIDRHETFISMGLDSLQCAELEMALQSEFPNSNIPTGIAMEKPTIEEMDAYLMSCSIACDTKNKDDNTYSNHIPLSPQQKGLVFLNELEPHARAQFNEPVVFAVKIGDFDEPRFRVVLNTLVMRHSVLRTIYFANGQSILSGTEAFFTCRTMQVDPQTFVQTPIDIKSTSMHAMVCDSVDRKVVFLVFHHIAVDGHSINIITKEIGMMYSGRELPLRGRHYADYARHTSNRTYEKQLVKWRQKLNHREFQLLITDKSRTAKRTYNGATIQKRIPSTLQKSLKKLRQAANCTNFCIFVAVYKFLIYKVNGISDFPIGFPSTLRSKEYADTVGCFVNVVPLVEPLDPSCTLVQYLNRLSATIAEAKSIEVPLDVLVSDLGVERDGNVSPLFQVLLVQDNVQLPAADTSVVLLNYTTQLAKYEQSWYFQSDGKSNNISVEYNSDLFRQSTIEDLIDRFLFILGTFEELSLNRALGDVAITKPVELNAIHSKVNSNIRDIPKATFLEIFRTNLCTTSLIKFRNKSISYRELDEESARIAESIVAVYSSHYGELPVGDICAVVFMERSLHLLAVIFAIWKSGMVAVPISLDWPPQRILGMLKLFNNPILIGTKSEKLNSSAKRMGIPVLEDELHQRCCARFFNRSGLSDLAYITCTSGTTGTPKAVCTQFSGHRNLAAAYTETYFVHNNSHTYQVVNCGFDIFFADLTKTFVNGASITLAEELIPNPAEMVGVTNAYIMPAYLSTLSLSDINQLSFLETVHFGGEAIQASALRSLLQTGVNIYQEYGVTEQTVYTTCNRMNVCSSITDIGAPYRNLHCLLRDQDDQLLPNRYQGICYLSGCGLFRGYYGNETLTTKTMRQGTFGKELCTGDLMKCEHGRLHCQGRHELQVKIRGRLIDLIEVSRFLRVH
ncbi:unnamed protein product [Haemonchus placei]|uniref:Carrier domain-containing protein n=1 Tax=Haemonchus placei TaxID=6290 RepID=A0A0N4VRZ6_HAEPC|nr:unnamed protein product [Haemonchus placei]